MSRPSASGFRRNTKTDLDELGVILPTDNKAGDNVPPPAAYWNLAGSLYAYLFIELSRLQIDVMGESQMVGYPTQFPSVSMMDWTTNQPNARFWVLKLIKDSFHPGDKLVETALHSGDVGAQAFVTPGGRKLLLVNKRNREIEFHCRMRTRPLRSLSMRRPATMRRAAWSSPRGTIKLEPFAVTVVSW